MRRIEVCRGDGEAAMELQVEESASLQEIMDSVARTCGVSNDFIRIILDGKRARALQEVPTVGQVVTAAVRSEEHGAVTKHMDVVSIPPKPVVMHQDMEGFNDVVALDEIIDNSIRAQAATISVSVVAAESGAVNGLACLDDGVGMSRNLALNHMRLAHTDSGIVTAPREPNKPLAAALYFSKELSRHGKGAAALLYFGHVVKTTTKVQDAAETTTVLVNYKDWDGEYQDTGTCSYKVKVTDFYDFVERRENFTDIQVSDLKEEVADKLAKHSQHRQWAQEVYDTYIFFIQGFPQALWATLPADLQPAAQPGRPEGGLTIDLFGIKLSQRHQLPAQVPRPRLSMLIDTFLDLSQQFRQGGGRPGGIVPFWLPVRWCEPGMKPQQVPENVRVERQDETGPAGKLQGVHRDFLLLMMYYPYKDGQQTKPVLIDDAGAEDLLYTAWCGRLIPKAFSRTLPPLVAEAAQSTDKGATAWRLTSSRLCAVLFCSPEVYTSNHKTELTDAAYDAVLKRLGAPSSRRASEEDLFVWSCEEHSWLPSGAATRLLLKHHKSHWAALEQEGEILDVDEVLPSGAVIGRTFKLPGGGGIIKAGGLVRLVTAEERKAAGETGSSSRGAGSSQARRGGGGGGSGGSSSGAAAAGAAKGPVHYRLVKHFRQQVGRDGPRVMALLREWQPSWVTGQARESEHAAALIDPVDLRQTKQLLESWEASAPRYLAWWDAAKAGDARVVLDILELTGVPSARQITAAQVPPSVAVCYVSNDNQQLVSLSRTAFWSQTIALNSEAIAVMWELQKASSTGRGAANYSSVTGNRNAVSYTQANKAQILGWQGHVQEPGRYRLHIRSCCPWVLEPLQYEFEVAALEARELDAVWDTAGQPCIRLGEELPTLVVRAKDASGKFVTLPFSKSREVAAAVTVAVKGSDNSTISFVNQRGFEAVLMHDRKTFKLKGCKLAHQRLRLQGNTPVQARIVLRLKLPVSQDILELADQDAPTLLVLSGPPSKLEARCEEFQQPERAPYKGAEVSRGSRVMAVKLIMLDESENKILDAGKNEAYCARVRFEPPFAAVRAKALGGNVAAQETPPAALGSRRRKSGTAAAAAAAAGAAAAAADQARVGWPIRVDGNVVEVEDDFRWRLPPGAGPAAVIIEVYAGNTLPPAADAQQPLLQHRGWYAMQEMHSGIKHPNLDNLQPAQRWEVWKGKQGYDWSQAVAFEVNTGGFDADVDRHVPTEATAAVPEAVMERFAEGFEARSDVVAGQLSPAFITPFGNKLAGAAPAGRLVKERVPFFLADYWNRLLGGKLVYEVVFVVPHTQQQLSGVQLELCNESDAHDTDFGGRAKLAVMGPGNSCTPVYDDSTQLEVAGGLLSLPPIAINPDWFTADNKGTAMLVLLDDEPFPGCDPAAAGPSNAPQLPLPRKEELGRFALRLAPAAEQLLVMAAGPLFNDTFVLLKGPASGPQGNRQRGKAQQDGQQDLRYQLKQQHVAAAGASSSRKAAAGAWSPWECAPAQRGPRTATQQQHIDPRHMQLLQGLRLQLGQPLTLHFVATDFLGCPVELSKQQRKDMVAGGVQLTPYDGSASLPVLVEDWKWGSSQASTAGASAMQPSGHLGGPFVNSCTFTANRGCGEAELSLSLTGSFGRVTTLRVPVLLEAGPVAVDGLRLQHADVTPQLEATTAHHSCCSRGFMDLHSGQLLEPPEDAAVEVEIKQEPGLEPGLQGSPEQQQQQQEQRSSDGSEIEIIEILTTEEPEDGDGVAGPAAAAEDDGGQPMDVDQQRPLSTRQQWLSSLGPGAAGLLFELEGSPVLIEGSAVKLQLQLYDSAAHEVAADKRGRLRLRWARNWQAIKARQEEQGEQGSDQQEPQQQQQDQQQLEWESLGEAAIAAGQAKAELRLGIGDEWCGEQLFQVLPEAPSGSELAGVLPVLLKVQVAPGPFPQKIYINNLADVAAVTVTAQDALPALLGSSVGHYDFADLAAGLQFGAAPDPAAQPLVIALPQLSSSEQGPAVRLPPLTIQLVARDGSTLAPSSLQPLQVQLEAWELPGTAAEGAAGTWVPVHGPAAAAGSGPHIVTAVLQELQLEASGDDAQLQHQQQVVFEVPLVCRELPPVAGLYRLQAEYNDSSLIGAETLSVHVGPFLLLPGPPAKLELAAVEHPQQQQVPGQSSRSRAASSAKRRSGRGPAAAAAAGDDRQQPVAPTEQQVVILQELSNTYSVQQTVQLRDCWGNAWRPAAEALSARLSAGDRAGADADDTGADGQEQEQEQEQPPQKRRRTSGRRATADTAAAHDGVASDAAAAAAGGADGSEAWSLVLLRALKGRADAAGTGRDLIYYITTLSFDPDGCCTVPASSLSALGIGSRDGAATVGEWQLLGQAVLVPTATQLHINVSDPAAVPLQVVLGSWHIASHHTADLRKQEVRLRSALHERDRVAKSTAAAIGQQQQELQRMAAELRKLQAEVVQQQRNVQQRSRNVQEHPGLLQLQQGVAADAPRAEQLAAGGGGRRLLDRPWMRAAERRSTVLRPVTDQEVQAPQMMPPSLMQLHQGSPSVLGPMVTLGSVECADVAAVLSALLRSDLQQLVCLNDSEAQQLRRVTDRDFTALHLPELFRYYHALPRQHSQPGIPSWLREHPQKLLPPTGYVSGRLGGVLDLFQYDSRDGFVGIAANLMCLNQQQLGLDVTVNARRIFTNDRDGTVRLQQDNRERTVMTLRETLWAWKLGTVLVFETEAHIARFRTKLHSKNRDFGNLRAVGLDGSTYNVKTGSMRFRLPVQDVSLRFGPAGTQAADNPLDLRLRYIKELGEKLAQEEQALQQQQAAVTQLNRQLQEQQQRVTEAQRKAKTDDAAIQKEKARIARELGAVQEELQQREQTGTRQ